MLLIGLDSYLKLSTHKLSGGGYDHVSGCSEANYYILNNFVKSGSRFVSVWIDP